MAGLDTDLATISAKLDLILAQFITLNKYLDACEPALGTCIRHCLRAVGISGITNPYPDNYDTTSEGPCCHDSSIFHTHPDARAFCIFCSNPVTTHTTRICSTTSSAGITSFATSKVPECRTSIHCIFITGSFANSPAGTGHHSCTNFGGHGDCINASCAIANSFTGSHGNTCGALGNC
jgi:hypothetical protein